jgi:hypothetical protein
MHGLRKIKGHKARPASPVPDEMAKITPNPLKLMAVLEGVRDFPLWLCGAPVVQQWLSG